MENIWPKTIVRRTAQGRQCTYSLTLRSVRATIVIVEKALSVTYSDCVFVALGIRHAMRERHIVVCGLSVSAAVFHIIP
jgi:hypothetical protein